MPFADHHDMVKAFPSNRSNHALGIGVLPGRAWRNDRFPDVQRLGLTRKSSSLDLVSVTDQMPWASSSPHASISCRPVQSEVGCSVTLKCTSRRRPWFSTTSTNRTRKVAVGTVKKSDAIRSLARFLYAGGAHAAAGARPDRTRFLSSHRTLLREPGEARRDVERHPDVRLPLADAARTSRVRDNE